MKLSIRSLLIATLTVGAFSGFVSTPINPYRGPFFREPLIGLIVASVALIAIPIGFIATFASIGFDQRRTVQDGLNGAMLGVFVLFILILFAPVAT